MSFAKPKACESVQYPQYYPTCLISCTVFCSVTETTEIYTRNPIPEDFFVRWKEVLKTNNRETIDEIDSILQEEVDPGVQIVDFRPGSVRCYLLCRTPTALNTLYQKLENGSLIGTMQSIFDSLIGGKDIVQVDHIEGRLSPPELQRRVDIFRQDLRMYFIDFIAVET